MDVNSLPKTVIRQHRGCDLNPGLLCTLITWHILLSEVPLQMGIWTCGQCPSREESGKCPSPWGIWTIPLPMRNLDNAPDGRYGQCPSQWGIWTSNTAAAVTAGNSR